jgi:hypothetical protein
MPDPHDDKYDPFPIDAVYHTIVSDSNPKVVRLSLQLLAAGRKRIFAEGNNFLGDPPLHLLAEVPELAGSGGREFENIAHGRGK